MTGMRISVVTTILVTVACFYLTVAVVSINGKSKKPAAQRQDNNISTTSLVVPLELWDEINVQDDMPNKVDQSDVIPMQNDVTKEIPDINRAQVFFVQHANDSQVQFQAQILRNRARKRQEKPPEAAMDVLLMEVRMTSTSPVYSYLRPSPDPIPHAALAWSSLRALSPLVVLSLLVPSPLVALAPGTPIALHCHLFLTLM